MSSKKSGCIFLVMFLVSVFSAFAADESIFYAGNIDMTVKISSTINIIETSSSSNIDYIKANLSFFPEENWRQEIKNSETSPRAEINDNSILYSWSNPSENQLELSVSSDIKTYNRVKEIKTKVNFPLEKTDNELLIYTKPTEKIDLNEDIVKLATGLAEGEDDLFVLENKIAEWVNKNIKYDLNTLTAEATQKSSWVLANKEGVCDEITNLFISMNRALGIPARFVSGISYSNSEAFENPWGPHGWAEVYFQGYGWVPFDVTYGEYGYIDAGHIQCRENIDSDKSTIDYEWKSRNIDLKTEKLNINVDIAKKSGNLGPVISINPEVFSDKVDFGSYNLIKAEIANDNDYYVSAILNLIRPVDIEIIETDGDNQKTVVIEPKSTKTVAWIVKVPEKLDKRKIYTFPLLIATNMNYSYASSFSSSYGEIDYSYADIKDIYEIEQKQTKNYQKDVELNCSGEDIFVNETALIKCSAVNKGNSNLNGVNVCLDNDCEITDLLIAQTYYKEYKKKFESTGKKIIEFKIQNSQIEQSQSVNIFANDHPSIKIIDLNSPIEVEFDEKFMISFNFEKSSYSTPINISASLKGGNIIEEWKIESLDVENKYGINLQGNMLNAGENNFKILAKYRDEKGNRYEKEENFVISLVNVTFPQKIMIFFNKIAASIDNLFNKNI